MAVGVVTAWDAMFNAATAGILAVFGVWVWTLRPRSRASLLLGLFAVAHGLQYVVANLWDVPATSSAIRLSFGKDLVFNLVSASALLGLARVVLLAQGASGRSAWRWTWPAVLATSIGTWTAQGASAGLGVSMANVNFFTVTILSYHVLVVTFAALPLAFAWAFRRSDSPERRHLMRTLSVAFMLWPAMAGTFGVQQFLTTQPPVSWQLLAAAAATTATGVVWLANIGIDPKASGSVRNAGLMIFAVLLFGALDAAFLSDILRYDPLANGPFFGMARLATVVILAHAILHQQVLGFDAKLRFALSKSTTAAIFVAVFFVASEAAQPWCS